GVRLERRVDTEINPAQGNSGLRRLAACSLDSLDTLLMPGYGYGINYDYGLFRQEIDNGYQKERPDLWRTYGTAWEIERPEEPCVIPVYGGIDHSQGVPRWVDWRVVIGVPADIPIVGYGGRTLSYL